MVLQDECNEVRTFHREELHVLANHVGIAHTESRMSLAHRNQVLNVVEHFTISGLLLPVDGIDIVRAIVGIVYALLVAHHFIAGEDERHTLRSEHESFRQLVQSHLFFHACICRKGGLDTVGQAHIVVTTYVADHLGRLSSPCFLAIVHRVVDDLRMRNATHQAIHDAHFVSRQSDEESTLLVVVERATETVTHLVREYGDARHLVGIGLHRQLFLRHLRRTCCPTFAIHEDTRVNLVQFGTDGVHGFNVVDTHQVETEAVDVVFVHPMEHGFYHVLAHHGTVRSGFIATTRCIGILAFRIEAIEIARHGLFEVAIYDVEGMVVHHVEHHADACLVERLNHLLEFLDTHARVVRVGRV